VCRQGGEQRHLADRVDHHEQGDERDDDRLGQQPH
jgi:hypothetical protein